MGKKSRKPKYLTCPLCARRYKLDGVAIPRHKDIRTMTLCSASGEEIKL